MPRGASLRVVGLGVRLGRNEVLRRLSLGATHGEFVAVVGPSGAGKSTLLRALAGLVAPAAGEVQVEADDGSARVAVVFQEPRLLPWLRVVDNVAFVLRGPRRERRRQALAALAAVNLLEAADVWPRQLSGGMAQRAALARALARAPHLLLLDEPFSAVDALTRLQLQDHLVALWDRHRFTVVLVTHDVDEAAYLADRVVVLGGRPARALAVVEVPAPRPRRRGDPRLAALREPLLDALAGAATTAPEPQGAAAALCGAGGTAPGEPPGIG